MTLETVIPAWVRDLVRVRLRQGRRFHRLLEELEGWAAFSAPELAAHQVSRLRTQLARAVRHVPHYRPLASSFQPADIARPADITRLLPLLDRDRVRAAPDTFRDERVRFGFRGQTSGTTGSPLVVYRDLASIVLENAMIWRQRRPFGVAPGDPVAVLRGEIVTPLDERRPPFWRIDRAANELILSSHHLTSAHLEHYLTILKSFAPVALYAYPSSARELARLVARSGKPMVPLKAVFTASETLSAADQELIGNVFGAPVVDRYGNAERTLAGGHCVHGGYHLWTDVTLAELIPAADHEGRLELIGTPLFGHAMPLFRYRTGDFAVPASGPPCPCGSATPAVERIEGRADPIVLTADGRPIGRLDHVWKGIQHVGAAQIVQEADLTVRLRVVPEAGFSGHDRAQILAQARSRLGSDLPLIIEEVDRLPRTRAGKFHAVVSHVPPERRQAAASAGERGEPETPVLSGEHPPESG
jgi:phenylacetate-CoA ligase